MGDELIARVAYPDLGRFDSDGIRRAADLSGTLVFSPDVSVDEVGNALGPSHHMILLSNDGFHFTGLITKPWLEEAAGRTDLSFAELLEWAASQGDRFNPLRELPPLRWCTDGMHYITACPCPDHNGSPCG